MIVDTSALVAIAPDEADGDRMLLALAGSGQARISAANLLETYLVIDGRRNARAALILDLLLDQLSLFVEPVTEAQVVIARGAFSRFGKGSGHRARLNFGDCYAYALSQSRDEPLLFVGDDFAQTDLIIG